MNCINCFHENTSVTNSRQHKKDSSVWRRRQCKKCLAIFTTLERPSTPRDLRVLNTNHNQSHPFNLSILTISIAQAFQHSPEEGRNHALDLAESVAAFIVTQHKQPATDDIAAATHDVLKRFDEIAALQYAASHGLITSAKRRPGRPSLF